MVLGWVKEARDKGARLERICKEIGLDVRTIQRWQTQSGGIDLRQGPSSTPPNKLSDQERAEVLTIANSPEFRDKSPKQIVPTLADQGRYLASESTFYRILHEHAQAKHRGRAKPPEPRMRAEHVGTGPNEVWSWDITYLRSNIAGVFYYLYLFVDVWSRKIVAQQVLECESSEYASELLEEAIDCENIHGINLVVHSDNGSPI